MRITTHDRWSRSLCKNEMTRGHLKTSTMRKNHVSGLAVSMSMIVACKAKEIFQPFCSDFATNFHLTGCFYLLFQSLLACHLPFRSESNAHWPSTSNERLLSTGKCWFVFFDAWIHAKISLRRCHFHSNSSLLIDWSLVLSSLDFRLFVVVRSRMFKRREVVLEWTSTFLLDWGVLS